MTLGGLIAFQAAHSACPAAALVLTGEKKNQSRRRYLRCSSRGTLRVSATSQDEDDRGANGNGFVEQLGKNFKASLTDEIRRNVSQMDSLVDTKGMRNSQDDIEDLSPLENKQLNFWTSPSFSIGGGAVVAGLLFLFIFVIGPPEA